MKLYCKKCRKLIEDDTQTVCPYCGYDNEYDLTSTAEIELSKIVEEAAKMKKEKKKKNYLPFIFIFVILFSVLLITYSLNDSKANIEENKDLTTTAAELTVDNNVFKYGNIKVNYNSDFGSSTGTIFYKQNESININFKELTLEEYNNITNSNELLPDKLNNIDTQTYATDNSYSHLFKYKDIYYEITVNYINNSNDYNENVQLQISRILDSIELD